MKSDQAAQCLSLKESHPLIWGLGGELCGIFGMQGKFRKNMKRETTGPNNIKQGY